MVTLQDAWTDAELAANRRGEIAGSQLAKIRGRQRKVLATTTLAGIALLAPLGYLLGATLFDRSIAIVFAIVPVACTLASVLWVGWRVGLPLRDRRVIALRGTLETRATSGALRAFVIDGQEVRPLYAGLDRLVGAKLTAYVIPSAMLVIAIEPGPA
ncbi:MAG TPA: hypothetical protein VLX92_21010 [Kofleriaceae bacterium]|nr:hypothetical protein [Kofleriaceae bacterium]